jgi:Protein of unknown function DUF262
MTKKRVDEKEIGSRAASPDLTPQEIVQIAASNERISNLINQVGDGSLIPRPEFQRRLVWTDKHRRNFIETVLRHYPFPEIYIATINVDAATGKSTRILVDGQQRITTLRAYFLGEAFLKLGSSVPSYESLSSEDKKRFLQYQVTVRDLGELRMQTVREIYRRINSTNYALNNMENLFAQYDGAFRGFCEWVSGHSFFADHGIFKETDTKRMFDLNFAITLVISVVKGYPHRNDEHEIFLDKYNAVFPQEKKLRAEFEALFENVNDFDFPSSSRAWKQIDLLTLLAETYHALYKDRLKLNLKDSAHRLRIFYTDVDKFDAEKEVGDSATEQAMVVMSYLKAATRASTDKYSRVQRGEIIAGILKEGSKA